MSPEVLSNIYLQYGIIGLVIVGFMVLLVYTIQSSTKREYKLHSIIDKLADELPAIRESVERIERKIFN